ncbi:MAG: hypothetical protein H8E86_02265 [Planctomycetes bacterium]|nr:hypothetical protein [Planctomycetota bacterium]
MYCSALADWDPQVYNAIKWTAPNQGTDTIAYTSAQGITRLPMAYHGGVDRDESGEISQKNIERFTSWVQETLPADYCGPVVMDYENPWWNELNAPSISIERLQEILSVYAEGLRVAKGTLPQAQWGYWGIPTLRNTSEKWRSQGLSLAQLISQCNALYPDIYDSTPGSSQTKSTTEHISKVLELANGEIPVYIYTFPRFTGQGGDHSLFIPDKEFLAQVNAAMRAVWVDANNVQHRIQGIIVWDSYKYSDSTKWGELDKKHKYYFELLQALTAAWKKAMQGVDVQTSIGGNPLCQYALSEPQNSGATLENQVGATEELPQKLSDVPLIENDRISGSRIRNNRVTE